MLRSLLLSLIAESDTLANQGLEFMRQMQQLATAPTDPAGYAPRTLQVLSAPFYGSVSFVLAAALYGTDLQTAKPVMGELRVTRPLRACTPLLNADQIKGRIAVVQRGGCMFAWKTRMAEQAGALAVIVIDNSSSSTAGSSTAFAMSGDGKQPEPGIASAFMYGQEGTWLLALDANMPGLTLALGHDLLNPAILFSEHVVSEWHKWARNNRTRLHGASGAFGHDEADTITVYEDGSVKQCKQVDTHLVCTVYASVSDQNPTSTYVLHSTDMHEDTLNEHMIADAKEEAALKEAKDSQMGVELDTSDDEHL